MNIKFVRASVAAAVVLVAGSAQAATVVVANAKFETLPAGGLNNTLPSNLCCGTYSVAPIPGWKTAAGQTSGQFDPTYSPGDVFNAPPPGGGLVAFTNGGPISQIVSATAKAGDTYTLTTDVGLWNQSYEPSYTSGTVTLDVGGHSITATGTPPTSGGWSIYTATYTAVAGDAGGPIEIVLDNAGPQGDFANVQLSAVPEPATWAMMLFGVGMIGAGMRLARRKNAMALATA